MNERGSVSVTLAAGIVVTLVLAMGVADLARVLAARTQARAAADAAALAVVQELAIPSGIEPVTLAASYAAANRAELASCLCAAGSFEAVVDVRLPVGPLLLFSDGLTVRARARAVVDLPPA